MEDENVLLIDEDRVKVVPKVDYPKFSYHTFYIFIIAVLSVFLMFALRRNEITRDIVSFSLNQNNYSIPENKDYTFESIKDFSKHNYDSILDRSVNEKDKFFNTDVKLAKPLKNILLWTEKNVKPMSYFTEGRVDFFNYGCEINNCFLTHNRQQLPKLSDYSAILFHNQEFSSKNVDSKWLDSNARDAKQIYILFETESSSLHPICDNRWESFFNWTWTYKVDSDIVWDFLTVRNKNTKDIVAPSQNVVWNATPGNLSSYFMEILKNKKKSVAWFISDENKELNTVTEYVKLLMNESSHLGFNIDVYNNTCPKDNSSVCMEYLKNDYKFYLSFERVESADFVTENFAKAMINFAVPIVFGGQANYNRFAPPNSYIDVANLHPKDMAKLIKSSLDNFDQYLKYHMWRNGYVYHFSYDHYSTHPLCKLCKALNNPEMVKDRRKTNLRKWWNGEKDNELCS